MANPVLLIGINGAVGLEVGKRLVAAGESVIATARTAEQCVDIKAGLPGLHDIFPLELGHSEDVLDTLRERIGEMPIAGVIVCAAASGYGPLETVSLAKTRAVLETNAMSCLAIYQACMPALRRTGGRIVLVSSYSGRVTLPFVGIYQASKYALEALADVMRMEGSMSGVKVVIVEPGGINTKMGQRMTISAKQDLANLSDFERGLYGDLYRNFIDMTEKADWSQMSSASQVADTILAAYRAENPEPRYIVGADAEYLISEKRTRSDREMDALAMELYGLKQPGR